MARNTPNTAPSPSRAYHNKCARYDRRSRQGAAIATGIPQAKRIWRNGNDRKGVESGHPGGAKFLTFARVDKSCGAGKMILAVTVH